MLALQCFLWVFMGDGWVNLRLLPYESVFEWADLRGYKAL